jgi:hypothetical protein
LSSILDKKGHAKDALSEEKLDIIGVSLETNPKKSLA